MAPQVEDDPQVFKYTAGFKYPAHRDAPQLCADLWLEDKRADDGAEGLWRIHDQLYDLTRWVDQHPGGRDWIRLTQGTDITEAFECHHVSTTAEKLLPKFFIRQASAPRNSQYTFRDDGFYRTLKNRVREALKTIPEHVTTRTKVITDLLMIGYLATAVFSAITFSFFLGLVSGVLLALTTIAAHNYFHQKDSFRMYYFNFSLMSSREWRISHAMSHHLYTNTVIDLELSLLQPFLIYLPVPDSILKRLISVVISPIFYAFLFFGNGLKRYVFTLTGTIKEVNKSDLIPYLVPILMYLLSGRTFIEIISMWIWILLVGSTYFGFIGLNAAHHHPEIFHDGDTPRVDRDWGLFQLDAVMDRSDITGSPFLVLTSFGDHALHHMFPTIDHGKLDFLYPVLQRTCQDLGVTFRMTSQLKLIEGQFCQLLRAIPNPVPPGNRWKWRREILPFSSKNKIF